MYGLEAIVSSPEIVVSDAQTVLVELKNLIVFPEPKTSAGGTFVSSLREMGIKRSKDCGSYL